MIRAWKRRAPVTGQWLDPPPRLLLTQRSSGDVGERFVSAAHRSIHSLDDRPWIEWFGNVQLIAGFERTLAIFVAGICGQCDGWRGPGRRQPAHLLDEGVAVFIGHADVRHDHVGRALLDQRQRLAPPSRPRSPRLPTD